jgi:hypothetical protein
MRYFGIGCLHLTQIFRDLSKLLHVLILCSFSLLGSIPLYGYANLFNHSLTEEHLIVSSLGLLQIKLVKYLWTHFSVSISFHFSALNAHICSGWFAW